MAQVKLLKIDTDGVSVEFGSADDITLNSFTAGAGPEMSPTGIVMNGQDLTDLSDLEFTDPSVGTINQTVGALIADNIMGKERNNVISTSGAILFPAISDSAGEVDSFKVPSMAAIPTATPAFSSVQGYLTAFGGSLYMWNGSAWNDLGISDSANSIQNLYTADEALAANDLLYISAADNVSLSNVSSGGASSRVIGLAVAAAIDTAPVYVQSEGVKAGFTGLTAGARYFANPSVAGGITSTKPVGSGNTIVQIGYAKSATQVHLHIEQLGRLA